MTSPVFDRSLFQSVFFIELRDCQLKQALGGKNA
jgi:hypothetical protein